MAAIVIVTYNSEQVIGACLDSCLQLSSADVLVVDNASSDGTLNQVTARPKVRVIASPVNLGFAGGVNLGFRSTSHPFVLLLNPDAALETDISALEALVSKPHIGAATGKLIGIDGSSQHAFHIRSFPTAAILSLDALGIHWLWPGNPINRRYRAQQDLSHATNVDQPAAAFLMIKRAAWERLQGFDEGFFPVWFEDVDFCKRLQLAGYRIVYEPGVIARHLGGHSAVAMLWQARHIAWYGSLLRYAGKHIQMPGRLAVTLSVCAGSFLRCLAKSVTDRSIKPMFAFVRVIQQSVTQDKINKELHAR